MRSPPPRRVAKPTAHCATCIHPDRQKIDELLLTSRMTAGKIACQFGLSRTQVQRHKNKHVQFPEVEAEKPLDVRQLEELKTLVRAELTATKDPKVRLAALQRLESLVTLEFRRGQDEVAQSALTSHPSWHKFLRHLHEHLCLDCKRRIVSSGNPGESSMAVYSSRTTDTSES
jgi:hypothetical protein